MAARMSLRGPDAEGLWSGKCVVLGHPRLDILDLDAHVAMRKRVEALFVLDHVATVYEEAYQLLVTGHRSRSDNSIRPCLGRTSAI
jgi:asparagine synthetase B (glutamine-hydrolysing)